MKAALSLSNNPFYHKMQEMQINMVHKKSTSTTNHENSYASPIGHESPTTIKRNFRRKFSKIQKRNQSMKIGKVKEPKITIENDYEE